MKCRACSAEVTMALNIKTNKVVPLVPYNPDYPKAVRYKLTGGPIDSGPDIAKCERDNDGPLMSHWADCSDPNRFNRSKKPDPDLHGKNADPGDQ